MQIRPVVLAEVVGEELTVSYLTCESLTCSLLARAEEEQNLQ